MTYETDKQAAANAVQVAANVEALNRWLSATHPEIPIGIATTRAFSEYFDNAFALPLTGADFEFALDNMDTKIVTQRVPNKFEIIDQICALLRSPDGTGRGGRRSDFDVNTARSQMQHWSLKQLHARLDEIRRAQTLSQKPLSELKQIVQSARPTYKLPPLPQHTLEGTLIDSKYLRRAPTSELKTLIRRHGEKSINARLRGE